MNKEHIFSRKGLEKKLDACINKTLGEVDVNHVFDKTITNDKITGIAGDVVEQSILGYPADNRQEPDLIVDGIKTELKTTGIRYSKKEPNTYEAKEPMSITAVSPKTIVLEKFDQSNFWHKLEHMLLVYYLYASNNTVKAAEYADFPIKGYEFHEFNEEDREILKNDWNTVRDFIEYLHTSYDKYEDEYPRISSELRNKLLYIDTAPKWPNPPRFRLKRTVVTAIVQSYFGRSLEQLPERYISYADIDRKCHQLAKEYAGKTVEQLIEHFKIEGNPDNKAISERIIVRMFDGHAKKLHNIEIFGKSGMIAKNVVITKKGLRTEDTKLFPIDFDELCDKNIKFEESAFYNFFADSQMICIVFEEPSHKAPFKDNVFLGFKRISFSQNFINDTVSKVWDRIRWLIFSNELKLVVAINKTTGEPIINPKTKTIKSAPNFPKSSEGVLFLRGTSTNSTKKPEIINGIHMYRQNLWIKGTYIAKTLKEVDFL